MYLKLTTSTQSLNGDMYTLWKSTKQIVANLDTSSLTNLKLAGVYVNPNSVLIHIE